MRATTSCEVGPAGLSMTRRPSTDSGGDPDRLLDLLDEQLLQHVDRARHRAPGGILVAAAPEALRDRADVDVALGSHAHAVLFGLDLFEDDDGLDLLDCER